MSLNEYIVDNHVNCNIYDEKGNLLVGIGTPITNDVKMLLAHNNWHFDKASKHLYDNIALSNKDILDLTNCSNSYVLFTKSKEIVELVLNNPIIHSNLNKIKKYDAYTYEHCHQVGYLAVAMGIKYGLNTHELINIAISSLTHDIGKCMIDSKIINKPGKLTPEEYEIVKKHSLLGSEIIKRNGDIDPIVSQTLLYHHENYDGTGYPIGLKKSNIPIPASIVHVCDVYDALISERPYKKKYDEEYSIDMLKNDSGTMFNPDIVDIFCSSIEIYKLGSIIELTDGTKVIVKDFIRDKKGNIIDILFEKFEETNNLTKKLLK